MATVETAVETPTVPAVPAATPASEELDFSNLLDLICPVQILIGTGVITVRQTLALRRHSILKLDPSVGEDLRLVARGITVARGEVLIVEDSTVVRITDIGVDPVERER
jgi:flagellar motor switch protein FliN/FliY